MMNIRVGNANTFQELEAEYKKRTRYISDQEWKGYASKWATQFIQRDVKATEANLSMFSAKVLISNHWNGGIRAFSKAQPLQVSSGNFTLAWQGDGNLVVYGWGKPLWGSGTNSSSNRFLVLAYNNLTISDGRNELWSIKPMRKDFSDQNTNVITHFGIDSVGSMIIMKNRRVVWRSPRLVQGYLAFPRMGDRPGGEMKIKFANGREHKIAPTNQSIPDQCAKHCNNFRGIGGWFQNLAPKKCDAFAYNEKTRKCYLMDKNIEQSVGEVDSDWVYYRRN